jgi:phytoene dehydrogenase-like protein
MRQEVTRVRYSKDSPIKVQTKRGKIFEAEQVIFNLPPWNIAPLLSEDLPGRLRNLPERPHDGWGAFMLYAGFEGGILPENYPLHHQVVVDEPLGEGNSLFLSFSPDWDSSRAPTGKRALTVSTHTNLASWWEMYENDPDGYERRKQVYSDQMLSVIEQLIPGFRAAADLVLPGTPVTFNRFTRRAWGWVGGFPQTDLLRVWGPRLAPRLWMVGDTIFPGQSVPAVMLGGVRTGGAVLAEMIRSRQAFWSVPRLKAERVIHKAT